ncbi:MAG: ATP-binding protein [Planctomycetota bacterium]
MPPRLAPIAIGTAIGAVILSIVMCWWLIANDQRQARADLAHHATVIASSFWNFDDRSARLYIELAADTYDYQTIVINDLDQQTFVSHSHPLAPRLLETPGWLPIQRFDHHITYQNELIGHISIERRSAVAYPCTYSVIITFLALSVIAILIHQWRLRIFLDRCTTAIDAARDRAEQANAAKSTFLARMAHEIRTPMTVILGYIELLANDRHLTERQRQRISAVETGGSHLLALVNDVLSLSKAESGRDTITSEAVDLRQLIAGCMTMFAAQAETRGLVLSQNIDESFPSLITSDGGKIRQILINLLGNAMRFTEDGSITVSVTVSDHRRFSLSVADSGPGVAPEDRKRIFASFEQTTVGRREGGGTGLGLAICSQFATLLNGAIGIDERSGGGSVFHVELPLEPITDNPTDTSDAANLDLDVLIVDDVEEIGEILSETLADLGCRPRVCSDGDAVLSLAIKHQPAAILLDLNLRNHDGREVMRQLRADPATTSIPVILMSAALIGDDDDLLRQLGAHAVLAKPIDQHHLINILSNLSCLEPQ